MTRTTIEQSFGPVRFLPGPNRGKYPHCHSVYVEGAGLLIDPASDRERLIRLRDEEGVSMVWLSHWHEDHLAHLDLFPGVPVWVHERDAGPLSGVEAFLDAYGLPEAGPLREFWRPVLRDQFHFVPRVPDRILQGGETISLGVTDVRVIHAPGHTPGNLALYFEKPGVLFLADYDLTPFGPWYGDLESSIEDTEKSVNLLAQIPAQAWLASHETGVFTGDIPRLAREYLAVAGRREERLWEFLSQPRSLDDIVDQWIAYQKPREPREFFAYAEAALMGKHLERLARLGRAREESGRWMRA
ncbi:MAG: MBL fold metallo-hydrolase [Proteobacteria bacterium]|nr:MBL fold metallo-hydrolase [Pseudomonadota bacterium]